MSIVKTLGQGQGYLKAGLFGWQGSGKTYTAMLLAVGLRRFFKLGGPIVMFDSEGGSEYIAPLVKTLTGTDLLGVRAQSLADLRAVADEALTLQGILLVDSITHPWKEVMEAHLARINDARRRDDLKPRTRLEVNDWQQIKPVWNRQWTDFFLNSPMHILICGRAGNIWGQEVNEETGRRELIQEGVKMKVEGEFAFEPSLLVYMEQEQLREPKGRRMLRHAATVLKDRFGAINGYQGRFDADDPEAQVAQTFAFFEPHIALLTPGAHAPVDTALKTDTGADAEGDTAWARERKARTILCEEIQGEIVAAIPGQAAEEKRRKADLLWQVFHTRSWTAVESMPSERLRAGLGRIRDLLGTAAPASVPAEPEPDLSPPLQASLVAIEMVANQTDERLALIQHVEEMERAFQLTPAGLAKVRQAGGISDLESASLDQLVLYAETLNAQQVKIAKAK